MERSTSKNHESLQSWLSGSSYENGKKSNASWILPSPSSGRELEVRHVRIRMSESPVGPRVPKPVMLHVGHYEETGGEGVEQETIDVPSEGDYDDVLGQPELDDPERSSEP